MEGGRDGIRVAAIHPGPIRTPMTHGMGSAFVIVGGALLGPLAPIEQPD